jgi:hypothetical protein
VSDDLHLLLHQTEMAAHLVLGHRMLDTMPRSRSS